MSAPAIAGDALRAGFAGLGFISFGIDISALERVLQRPVTIPEEEDEKNCFYVPGDANSTYSVMVVNGRVARIDVDEPGISTLRGASVGDTVDRVRKLYGQALEEAPHFYAGLPDLYLTYWSKDRSLALRFETREGKISRYYFGFSEQVQYVEGCL